MRTDLRGVASALALGAALASIGYAALALNRLRAFGRRAAARPAQRPPVTILKPVRGVEPGLEENLRSFCAQNYPAFEVIIGVRERDDPALDVIRHVAAEFSERTTVVVGDDDGTSARFRNPKIDTLAPMLERARYDVLVIADSNMRVDPHYLDAVVAPFAGERVGAVTCIYRGEPAGRDLASVLGAMWITEQFAPSVLVANSLEPLTYCFGATMAVRGDVLDAIGGLAALGDQLADDHALGRLVTEHGHVVALAPYVVTNVVSERGLRALLMHELRWARTIRAVRPASYAGIVLTYPLPLAILSLVLARDRRPAFAVLGLTLLLRMVLHRASHAALGTTTRPPALLVPIRDALGSAVWALGFAGHDVRWRDDILRVGARGTLAASADD